LLILVWDPAPLGGANQRKVVTWISLLDFRSEFPRGWSSGVPQKLNILDCVPETLFLVFYPAACARGYYYRHRKSCTSFIRLPWTGFNPVLATARVVPYNSLL